jgi:hypothetical protein
VRTTPQPSKREKLADADGSDSGIYNAFDEDPGSTVPQLRLHDTAVESKRGRNYLDTKISLRQALRHLMVDDWSNQHETKGKD